MLQIALFAIVGMLNVWCYTDYLRKVKAKEDLTLVWHLIGSCQGAFAFMNAVFLASAIANLIR